MGNGPARDAIDSERDVLMAFPRLAVNFSALTPDFRELRPDYYILADIAFFAAKKDRQCAETLGVSPQRGLADDALPPLLRPERCLKSGRCPIISA